MRKIEAQMINAIRNRRDWRSGNTSVDNTDHGVIIRLHGNKIARVDYDNNVTWITDAGWQTTTTKSRLNAILAGINQRGYVYQKDYVWHLVRGDETVEMERNDSYPVSM